MRSSQVLLIVVSFLAASDAADVAWPHRPNGCVLIHKEYVPSVIEQEWLANVPQWQRDADVYCAAVERFKAKFQAFLDAIKSGSRNTDTGRQTRRWGQEPLFSKFQYSHQCRGTIIRTAFIIEPLVAALRHPLTVCTPVGRRNEQDEYLLNRDYIVLQSHPLPGQVAIDGRSRSTPKAFLFDLGASTYLAGVGGASQKVMLDHYASLGIRFDRVLMWEANKIDPTELFHNVPDKLLGAYQVRAHWLPTYSMPPHQCWHY